MRELRASLSLMRLEDLSVGSDDRNRYLISAYQSRTGRNQPSSKQSIFGTAVWLRGIIQPSPGQAVAYLDWSQQEIGIAAVRLHDVPAPDIGAPLPLVLANEGDLLLAYLVSEPDSAWDDRTEHEGGDPFALLVLPRLGPGGVRECTAPWCPLFAYRLPRSGRADLQDALVGTPDVGLAAAAIDDPL